MAFVKGQGLMDDKFKNLDEEQQARAEAHMASRRGVRRASFAGIPQTSVLKRASEQVKASKLTPLLLWTKLSIRYGGVEKAAVAGAQGSVQRGTFTALLGPAGSGKTTLLQCLGGRLASDARVSGSLAVDGKPLDSEAMKAMSSYVADEDLFLPHLETLESLFFVARMRVRSGAMNDDDLNDLCMLLLEELGLADKAAVLVCVQIKSSTRLQCARNRTVRTRLFGCASRTRREQSIRPKSAESTSI